MSETEREREKGRREGEKRSVIDILIGPRTHPERGDALDGEVVVDGLAEVGVGGYKTARPRHAHGHNIVNLNNIVNLERTRK